MSSIYKRAGIWQYQRQRPGQVPFRKSLGKGIRTRSEAIQAQRAIDARLDRGESLEPEAKPATCLSLWVEPYKAWAVKHVEGRTLEQKMRYVDEWIALTGKDDVASITAADVDRFKDALLKKGNGNVTINNKFIHLGAYVERCRRMKLHTEPNPFSSKEHEKLPVAKRHKAWISNPDDIKKVIELSRQYDYDLFLFVTIGLFAGLRRAEIDAAEWTWINWHTDPPLFQVINAADDDEDGFTLKDKTDRTIPICDDLREVLEHGRDKTGYIIAPECTVPNVEGLRCDLAYRLKKIGQAAELKFKLTPHILRHTFASRLASKGVSLLEIAKYLGHEDPKLTYSCYAHLAPSSESINKLNLGV